MNEFKNLVGLKKSNHLYFQTTSHHYLFVQMRASIEDFNKVERAAQKFAESVGSGKSQICKDVFIPEAVMFGYLDGKLEKGSIQNLYNNIDNAGADPKYVSRVDVVHIDGTVAIARVLEDNWSGHNFSDYLLLLKFGDDWKIVAKVYNELPKK